MRECQKEADDRCTKGSFMGIAYCSCNRKYCREHLVNHTCPNCRFKAKIGTAVEVVLLFIIIISIAVPLSKGYPEEDLDTLEFTGVERNRFLGDMSNLMVVDLGTS